MTPATSTGREIDAIKAYLAAGFEIVQVQWDANWEAAKSSYIPDTFGNIQRAACRPAGFLHFVYSGTNPVLFQPGFGMCAHGLSAGSAAVVYALAWYGAGWGSTGYLDNVELLSGPVLSAVDLGCEVPVAGMVNVCSGAPGCKKAPGVQPWLLSPEYIDMPANSVRQWSNISSCANTGGTDNTFYLGIWNGMSILSSNISSQQLSYPSTSANAWLCANVDNNAEAPNNSGPQGWLFYSTPGVSFVSGWAVNAVTNCDGPEGVMGKDAVGPDGNGGLADVTGDMIAQCVHRTH